MPEAPACIVSGPCEPLHHRHHAACVQAFTPVSRGQAERLGVPMPLSDDQARELSRAAANVRTWTEKRNEAIKAAHAAGGGIREIAKATGLNVGTIHTMIHGRKR